MSTLKYLFAVIMLVIALTLTALRQAHGQGDPRLTRTPRQIQKPRLQHDPADGQANRRRPLRLGPVVPAGDDSLGYEPNAKSLTWVPVGPAPLENALVSPVAKATTVAGRVTAIATDPTNTKTIYVATNGGGIWKTVDGGQNWKPLTDTQDTLTTGALAVAPSNPKILYAGTGDSNFSIYSMYGYGLLKSTDSGKSWTLLRGNDGAFEFGGLAVSRIVVHPKNPNIVYISLTSCVGTYAYNGAQGVWKTTDGGKTWDMLLVTVSTFSDYTDLVMDPTNPNILYAAVGTPYSDFFCSVYKTTDAGKSWTQAGDFPHGNGIGRISLAISKSNPKVLYAAIADPGTSPLADTEGDLLYFMKTTNGGKNWKYLNKVPNFMNRLGWYTNVVAVDPKDPNTVYAGGHTDFQNGGINGFIVSHDGGKSWQDLTVDTDQEGPHTDHHALVFDGDGNLLDGNDGGLWRLNNGRWENLNGNLGAILLNSVALDPNDPTIAYGGTKDNGTARTAGDSAWEQIAPGDGGTVRVDFNNTQTLYHTYAGNFQGFIERSDDGGKSWTPKTQGIDFNDPSNLFAPFAMDPADPAHLLVGTDHLYVSTDRGDHWKVLGIPNKRGFNPSGFTIDAIAIRGLAIYVTASGMEDGLPGSIISASFDGGKNWRTNYVPGVSDHLADIAIDPNNSKIAYVVRDNFNQEFQQGHIFRTTDGNKSWKNVNGDLDDIPVNTIRVDDGGILYIGTDYGVYSRSGRGKWQPLGSGLPHARVVDLQLYPKLGLIAAATMGRGMWLLKVK